MRPKTKRFSNKLASPRPSPISVEDFTNNYLEIRENTILSRVELVIKDQHLQITLDRLDQSQDLFVEVLGFEQTQTLHSPASTWREQRRWQRRAEPSETHRHESAAASSA